MGRRSSRTTPSGVGRGVGVGEGVRVGVDVGVGVDVEVGVGVKVEVGVGGNVGVNVAVGEGMGLVPAGPRTLDPPSMSTSEGKRITPIAIQSVENDFPIGSLGEITERMITQKAFPVNFGRR